MTNQLSASQYLEALSHLSKAIQKVAEAKMALALYCSMTEDTATEPIVEMLDNLLTTDQASVGVWTLQDALSQMKKQEPLPKFPYAGEQKDAREMYALGQEELAQAGIETGPASCFGDTYAYVFSAKTLGPEAWNASASSWTATVLDGAWHVGRGGEHGDWYRSQQAKESVK